MKNHQFTDFQKVIHIEGIGTVSAIGELNFEQWLNTLLDSKYINGNGDKYVRG